MRIAGFFPYHHVHCADRGSHRVRRCSPPVGKRGDKNQKNIDNTRKLERVEEAMRSFMAFNGRRPCPAQGSYKPGDANFLGVEASIAGTCTGGIVPPRAARSR